MPHSTSSDCIGHRMEVQVLFSLLLLQFLLLGPSWAQSLVDECGGDILCPVGAPCEVSGSQEDPVTRRDCTEGGECVEGLCRCTSGFIPTSYGFCLPTFNSSCAQSQCNEEAHLICHPQTRRCICPFTDSQFSEAAGTCLASVEASCSDSGMDCTENAFCNFMFDWKCHCKGGFSPTADDRCLPSFASPCEEGKSSTDCNPDEFLSCRNHVCVCQEGRLRDEEEERCLALVGGGCDAKVTGDMFRVSSCIQGATCTPHPNTDPSSDLRSGICQCPSGRGETGRKTCSSTAPGFILPWANTHQLILILSFLNLAFITCE